MVSQEQITNIVQAIQGLKYYEWCKIRNAVEQKYTSASNKVVLEDAEAIRAAICQEIQ